MIKRELEAKLSQRNQEIESLMAILQAHAELLEFGESSEVAEDSPEVPSSESPEAEEVLPKAAEESPA